MNNFFAFLLGGLLLGDKETIIVQSPEPKIEVGKCNACPEIGLYRSEFGFYADDFCYEMYKKHRHV